MPLCGPRFRTVQRSALNFHSNFQICLDDVVNCVRKEENRNMKQIYWMIKNRMEKRIRQAAALELRAVGVVEVILILVVLIALVIIFQEQLTQLVNAIFASIRNKAGTIY